MAVLGVNYLKNERKLLVPSCDYGQVLCIIMFMTYIVLSMHTMYGTYSSRRPPIFLKPVDNIQRIRIHTHHNLIDLIGSVLL